MGDAAVTLAHRHTDTHIDSRKRSPELAHKRSEYCFRCTKRSRAVFHISASGRWPFSLTLCRPSIECGDFSCHKICYLKGQCAIDRCDIIIFRNGMCQCAAAPHTHTRRTRPRPMTRNDMPLSVEVNEILLPDNVITTHHLFPTMFWPVAHFCGVSVCVCLCVHASDAEC